MDHDGPLGVRDGPLGTLVDCHGPLWSAMGGGGLLLFMGRSSPQQSAEKHSSPQRGSTAPADCCVLGGLSRLRPPGPGLILQGLIQHPAPAGLACTARRPRILQKCSSFPASACEGASPCKSAVILAPSPESPGCWPQITADLQDGPASMA